MLGCEAQQYIFNVERKRNEKIAAKKKDRI